MRLLVITEQINLKVGSSLQEGILQIFRKFIKEEKSLGIAEALLIGYRNDMDSELNQTYTNAGVVHVIAISGLHLGLIFTSMWWLLSRLRVLKNKILITGGQGYLGGRVAKYFLLNN